MTEVNGHADFPQLSGQLKDNGGHMIAGQWWCCWALFHKLQASFAVAPFIASAYSYGVATVCLPQSWAVRTQRQSDQISAWKEEDENISIACVITLL